MIALVRDMMVDEMQLKFDQTYSELSEKSRELNTVQLALDNERKTSRGEITELRGELEKFKKLYYSTEQRKKESDT